MQTTLYCVVFFKEDYFIGGGDQNYKVPPQKHVKSCEISFMAVVALGNKRKL